MIVAEGGRGFQSKECVSHTHSSFSTKSGMFFALQIFKTPSFFAHYCHNRELLLEISSGFVWAALLLNPAVSCCLVCCTDTYPGTGPGY